MSVAELLRVRESSSTQLTWCEEADLDSEEASGLQATEMSRSRAPKKIKLGVDCCIKIEIALDNISRYVAKLPIAI